MDIQALKDTVSSSPHSGVAAYTERGHMHTHQTSKAIRKPEMELCTGQCLRAACVFHPTQPTATLPDGLPGCLVPYLTAGAFWTLSTKAVERRHTHARPHTNPTKSKRKEEIEPVESTLKPHYPQLPGN